MEDAHLTELDIGTKKDTQLFGVFDGHGGNDCVDFINNRFISTLVRIMNDNKSLDFTNFIYWRYCYCCC